MTVLQLLAHAPSVFEPVVTLGISVLTELEIPDDLRELVVLRVARDLDAPYVEAQHLTAAYDHNVDPAKAQAVAYGSIAAAKLSDVERVVLDFTHEVLLCNEPSSNTITALRSLISDRQIVELLVVIGYYTLVCRLTTTCRVVPQASFIADLMTSSRQPKAGDTAP